jgi:hypothetical protein
MKLIKDLWIDEAGAVLAAEVVMVGTVAVLASVVGLNLAATAVNDELTEFSSAIRSLDQSYAYLGHQSCRAWSAGSYYRQPDVQQSLSELCGEGPADVESIRQTIDAQRTVVPVEAPIAPAVEPPPANELPAPTRN